MPQSRLEKGIDQNNFMLHKDIPTKRNKLPRVKADAIQMDGDMQLFFYQSLNDVPHEWDDLAPSDNIFLQRTYLSLLEQNPPIGMRFCYLLYCEKNKPVGIAIGQIQHFKADRSLNKEEEDKTPCFFTTLGRYFKGLLASKVDFYTLVIGNLLLTGEHGYYFNSKIPKEKAVLYLEKGIVPVQEELERLNIPIRGTLIKEIYQENKKDVQGLVDRSFVEFTVQPNMVMDLHWETIEEYKAALSSKYRVRMKRAFKKGAAIEKRSLSAEEIEANLPRLYELYTEIANNSGFNLINLNENYLLALKQNFQDHFNLTAYYLDGKIIAYFTTILNGKEMEAHFLGYDHDYNREYQVYLNILYDILNCGIENKAERIVFARTAMAIKSSIGAVPIEMYCYFRHRSTFSNKFLHPLLDYLRPKDDWEQRHPFK